MQKSAVTSTFRVSGQLRPEDLHLAERKRSILMNSVSFIYGHFKNRKDIHGYNNERHPDTKIGNNINVGEIHMDINVGEMNMNTTVKVIHTEYRWKK